MMRTWRSVSRARLAPTRPYLKKVLTEDVLEQAGFEQKEKDAEPSEPRARRKKRAQTTKDIQRERYANRFYVASLLGGVAALGYLSRDWDLVEEQTRLQGEETPNGYAPGLMYERCRKRMGSLFSFFSEPMFENLLPPPPPEQYRRPMTLVVTLDDFLVHSEWDTKHGWRTAKRPGVDYFLGYLSQYYEIVVFSLNLQMFSDKTVMKLDPLRAYIQYALFKEGCRYKDGKIIKDLSLLNRDLNKVVAIDVNADTLLLQPENSIILKPWDGTADDTLVRLIPLLEYMATQPIKDVRPVLSSFSKEKIIEEYAEREARLRARWREENAHLFTKGPNVLNILLLMFGMQPKEPKMPLDLIREHGQLQYENLLKFLRENEAKFMEEERKMKEEYGKMTLNKLMTEGMPTAEDIAKAQAEKAQAST